ncbi:D-aminoacyl-tRNA deacylase [Corynebacterium glyciniphilum]|uniref:D-tyrosyl-tRNA(Tyr) deacylase n=1 Tax=Corynebacterium glyciniphilum AJ 3170 TaxID=1404245 RepID=X5E9D6_9CORY|nr:D-aminoacyl-tRNA deacylase [Corynebacterium glyciniphilum]AHW64040.1 D-tyrosyl-tRNA(Tyr) deacylase [Corynebacterium glyciniphilum AJ 3170]
MKAVVSTVGTAEVTVGGVIVGSVDSNRDGEGRGALLALVGVGRNDRPDAWRTMARKIAELRILPPVAAPWEEGRGVGAQDNGAEILIVSQFTLMGATAKGRRPSWSDAAPGDVAEEVISRITEDLRNRGLRVETGTFGAMMEVSSTNLGPYTVIVEAP